MQSFKLVPTGISATAALAITGDVATGLTAAGSTAATALALAATNNFVSTTGASTGVILPVGSPGDKVYVYNGGANSLTVYPPTGATINNAASSFAVATTRSAIFVYASATQLMAVYGA